MERKGIKKGFQKRNGKKKPRQEGKVFPDFCRND